MSFTRHIPLPGSYNIRDLGGYAGAKGPTVWRRVLRGDSLHRLSPGSMDELRQLGLTTVIDLRHAQELDVQPNPFAAGVPGVVYHNISLFDGLDPTHPAMAEAEDLLLALYCEALVERGAALAQVMRVIANAPGGVLFHCTAGKDRTGIVAAFLLQLAEVPQAEVIADYSLTTQYSPPMFAAMLAELRARGEDFDLSSPLLKSEATTMEAFLDHLRQTYGDAETYLVRHGLTEAEIAALRMRMNGEFQSQGAV
ncbi:tyrosine-protein phosphatase [Paracoccus sp. SCSIO 75233]|uniref:tyrosine-protein phosphatase n=1 Tax=Paracoccus sp. SCSIO 75233 TaxID=3017782 RepID=UPI0022EFEC76|nr:tyrosine-protein phosphatase [Paracoccus sp. SCSIO 75233]WBU53765.1 tyrosine-protein phosphatase [Paracoccus sp. SCSIO 75233]